LREVKAQDSWYSFLLEAESTPGPEGFGQFKKNPPHRDLNPRPSGLQHSALTATLPRAPSNHLGREKKEACGGDIT
jgi:hypothetical protein